MGGLTSSLTRWEAAPPGMAEEMQRLDEADAQAELVRRWLRVFGPATDADVAWWTGITLGKARTALQAIDAVPVDIDGATGYLLPDDVDPEPATEPWVALLPRPRPHADGVVGGGRYLGDHKVALFDTNGNVGPTVWCDGRIIGGWAQRPDGTIVWRLLEKVGKRPEAAIEERARYLQQWLGDVRVTPRFRTPLERELHRLNDLAVGGPPRQLVPAAQLQLAQDRRHVGLDGLHRKVQPLRNLLVGVPPGDQPHDLPLPMGQQVQLLVDRLGGLAAEGIQHEAGQPGREDRVPFVDPPDGGRQVGG